MPSHAKTLSFAITFATIVALQWGSVKSNRPNNVAFILRQRPHDGDLASDMMTIYAARHAYARVTMMLLMRGHHGIRESVQSAVVESGTIWILLLVVFIE